MPSRLDRFYRSILFSKYFVKGWGDPEGLIKLLKFRKIISNRASCLQLVDPNHPVTVTRDEETGASRLIEGYFESPFNKHLPSLLPQESKNAFFQMILPKKWKDEKFKPVCIHMAGTGDHFFWRRRKLMAQPLLKEAGIASIILENPFYGSRKPKYQVKSVLHNVSDIFVMGGCLILEALVLFYWCQHQGYGPLGVTGLSMGGHMASLAATNWPEPAVLVPCLSWSTASGVFTKGVMSRSINWEMLASQYSQNDVFRQEIRKMLHSDVDLRDAFRAGQRFAHDFPKSMSTLLKTNDASKTMEIRNEETNFYYKVNTVFVEFLKSKFSSSDNSFTLSNDDLLHNSKLGTNKVSGFGEFHDAVTFMRGIMDECTHLKNFSIPIDTSLIISVFAQEDGYVPREGSDITSIWPGAEVRILNTGHIAAFVLYLGVFRKAIIDAFERYKEKY